MTEPKRIQLSRRKGWRKPQGAIVVARPSRWGNPYSVQRFGRPLAIRLFDVMAHGRWDPALLAGLDDDDCREVVSQRDRWLDRLGAHPAALARSELRGHDLACWCPLVDQWGVRVPCHADVLLALANPKEAS